MTCDGFREFYASLVQAHADAEAAHSHYGRCAACRQFVATAIEEYVREYAQERIDRMHPWPPPGPIRQHREQIATERGSRREEHLAPDTDNGAAEDGS